MFGIVEGFAIAGAIAAIVSAFKDAGSLFGKWRSQSKKASESQNSSEVQKSLQANPANIERRYDDGFLQLGPLFAQGDSITHSSLLSAILHFNRTLIECLRMALAGSFSPDLRKLWQVSEGTGHQALSTLSDLYQRVALRRQIPRNREIVENENANYSAALTLRSAPAVASTRPALQDHDASITLLKRISALSFTTQAPLPSVDESISTENPWNDPSNRGTFDESYAISSPSPTSLSITALEEDLNAIGERRSMRASRVNANIPGVSRSHFQNWATGASTGTANLSSLDVLHQNLRALSSDVNG